MVAFIAHLSLLSILILGIRTKSTRPDIASRVIVLGRKSIS